MNKKDVEIRFIKLKYGEDIVAFLLEETEEIVHIKRPLVVNVQNNMSTGKQMMEVREWLPPVITAQEDAYINKTDIIVMLEVRDSFKDEFNEVINFLYGVVPKIRAIIQPDNDRKVIPFVSKDHKLN